MNILLVTSSYPPEVRSSSHLMQELAEELSVRGHKVMVATTYPRCNLPEKIVGKSFDKCSIESNIVVLRINTPIHPHQKCNFVMRGISQVILPYIYFFNIKKYVRNKIDAVIVYSPPLTLAMAGEKVKKRYGARFLLNIQDIFPQNAIDLGILNRGLLINLFERTERRAYENADVITVHSVSNKKFLTRNKGISPDKVRILHNWVAVDGQRKAVRSGECRKEYGVENKFIFFFGGVMGPSQGLDLIVEAARNLDVADDLAILMLGDGTERKRLEKLVRDYSLRNVLFHPFVSKEDYENLLREVDVGLVCLSSKNKTPVVPGKILSYMAASVPVLALINRQSDGHHIIREAGCGYSEVSDDARKAAILMLKMYQEKERLTEYGKNGFNYAAAHFSRKVCVDKLEDLLR